MKRRNIIGLASLVGLVTVAWGAKTYQDYQKQEQFSRVISEVRELFSKLGPIATVYIDQVASDKVQIKGGVVMEDGRAYRFDYLAGEIFYEEESHA